MKFALAHRAAPLLAAAVFFAGAIPAVATRAGAVAGATAVASAGDRAVTEVVKLLESMLEKSKSDGDAERTMFGKYKCYCDTNEEESNKEIADLSRLIDMLGGKIEELKASTGELSKEVAALTAGMDANEKAREEATSLRLKEAAAFTALKSDLEGAISQMNFAITTLSEVGADQTMSVANDHKKFMAGYKSGEALLKLRATVKQALIAASTIMSKKQAVKVQSFIQAPFTGSYTAQSGEVVGILKDMRDTFKDNLATANSTENNAVEAYRAYMATMLEEHGTMKASFDTKQGTLSSNDLDLSTKIEQKGQAESLKAESEEFLSQLLEMCAAKAKEYERRKLLRAGEEASISQAVSILNSDAAFETFGTVSATSFFQRASVHRHSPQLGWTGSKALALRQRAQALLRKASGWRHSRPLSKIMALLEADNPFDTVLAEIEKMILLIEEEEKADDRKLEWCSEERQTAGAGIIQKKSDIRGLNQDISQLTTAIEDPVSGLKADIKEDEDSLASCLDNQKTQTKDRMEENLVYQKDIENLVEAKDLLGKAIVVLKKYYKEVLDKEAAEYGSLLQVSRKQPTPPSTWDEGAYKGQSERGGTDAISTLEFILENTAKEEKEAHSAEDEAQTGFEDSMIRLKAKEKSLQESLVSNREKLAEAEKDLLGAQEDLKKTKADKKALEQYLLDIKPGCDFITDNIETRKANRVAETEALEEASRLLKGTPAYLTAVAAAHDESLGDCLSTCSGAEEHVDCKACLAKVTVPAYCAGHRLTEGC